jgi:phosphopantothenoylcysteine decarboxylase/phosphopantothenate--cysteine ligase
MHTEMWQNAATRDNIATLRARGVHVVGPASGQLTGSDSGPGRMAEPADIVDAALAALRPRDLAGRRVVVTAGGTREPLDPVRFLGNRSSGRQGVALAEAARDRGAQVVLVAAHLEVRAPAGIEVRAAGTAEELRAATVDAASGADAVVMAAAVADYRPETVADAKIKKEQQGDELALRLVRNPDILAELAAEHVAGRTVIGFAAETEPDDTALLELGRAKVARKGCDYLVVNRVGWSEGFATEGNAVVIVSRAGDIVTRASGTKREVADAILDLLS